jgi:hypothetical protein
LCEFFVGKAIAKPQNNESTLHFGEVFESLLNLGPARKDGKGEGGLFCEFFWIAITIEFGRPLHASQMIDAAIAGNGQQPCASRGFLSKSCQACKGVREDLLGQVFCGRAIADDCLAESEYF